MRQRGLTLLEVLAALVILAVLLGGVLSAKDRARKQQRDADARIEAVAVLDRLLRLWADETGGFTWPKRTGSVPGHDSWRWAVAVSDRADAAALLCRLVTVSVIDEEDRALASVQLLTPRVVEDSP